MVLGIVPIVVASQPLVGILILTDLEEPVKVGQRLLLVVYHQIVFVGHRPPYIAISRESGYHVAQVSVVVFTTHSIIAPLIVRVEKDHVGLNTHVGKLPNAKIKVAEEFVVGPSEVILVAITLERIGPRFGVISMSIPFWKHAHADFVQRFPRKENEY